MAWSYCEQSMYVVWPSTWTSKSICLHAVLDLAAGGGSAVVYVAQDLKGCGQKVALKVGRADKPRLV